jgi:toxic protein SymE
MRKRLTVSRLYRQRRSRPWHGDESWTVPKPVPFVRLSGRWLRELGFSVGERIEVEATPGRLVLRAAPAGEVAEPIELEPEA